MPRTLCILHEGHRNKSIPDDGVDFRKPSVFMLEGLSGSAFYGLRGKSPSCVPKSHRAGWWQSWGDCTWESFLFSRTVPQNWRLFHGAETKMAILKRSSSCWKDVIPWGGMNTCIFFFWLHPVAYRILVLWPGIKPMLLLQWNCRVLATGQPGKALNTRIFIHEGLMARTTDHVEAWRSTLKDLGILGPSWTAGCDWW